MLSIFGQELSVETLEKFSVRCIPSQNTLLLPCFDLDGSIAGIKVMTFTPPPPVESFEGDEHVDLPQEGKVISKTLPR